MAVGTPRSLGGNRYSVGFSLTASGQLAAADTLGRGIKVTHCMIMSSAAFTVSLQNGSGGADMAQGNPGANGGFCLPEADRGWCKTDANTALYLALSGTGTVYGVVCYELA